MTPPGLPERIWIVIRRPNGERDVIHREPLEGILAWAKGVDLPTPFLFSIRSTVRGCGGLFRASEYQFAAVIHIPPPLKEAPKP